MHTTHTGAALLAAAAFLGACAPAPRAEIVPAAQPAPQQQAAATEQFQLPPAAEVQTAALPGADLPGASEEAVVTGQSQPSPRRFAGRWKADVAGQSCSVVLTAGAPQSDGSRLASAPGCGGTLEGATGWRLGEGSIDIVGPSGVLATLAQGAPGQLTGGGVTLMR